MYAQLFSEVGLDDYMGMSISQIQREIAAVGHAAQAIVHDEVRTIQRAQISNGVRQVVLCKDAKGKVGIGLQEVSKGVFVSCVWRNSPAALAGLRVGDQIIQVNGKTVCGMSGGKVLDEIRKSSPERIQFMVRDRPFERTITLHKDSVGHMGFIYKHGKITKIVVDSSAARNGLTIDHQLLEVNGQNVIGLTDEELGDVFSSAGSCITLTIMPSVIYDTMAKNLSSGMRKSMDHSVPDL